MFLMLNEYQGKFRYSRWLGTHISYNCMKYISTSNKIIETPKQLFLVMEYATGGELFDYIVQNQRIKDLEAARFFN